MSEPEKCGYALMTKALRKRGDAEQDVMFGNAALAIEALCAERNMALDLLDRAKREVAKREVAQLLAALSAVGPYSDASVPLRPSGSIRPPITNGRVMKGYSITERDELQHQAEKEMERYLDLIKTLGLNPPYTRDTLRAAFRFGLAYGLNEAVLIIQDTHNGPQPPVESH